MTPEKWTTNTSAAIRSSPSSSPSERASHYLPAVHRRGSRSLACKLRRRDRQCTGTSLALLGGSPLFLVHRYKTRTRPSPLPGPASTASMASVVSKKSRREHGQSMWSTVSMGFSGVELDPARRLGPAGNLEPGSGCRRRCGRRAGPGAAAALGPWGLSKIIILLYI